MSHTLLIADHDQALCEELCRELAADDYDAVSATSRDALSLALGSHRPDLLLLGDFEGPGASARLLAALRGGAPPFAGLCVETATIVLAEDGGELALLRAFEAGADDFMRKPASYLELRARIRAVIACSEGERVPSVRRIGALEIDGDRHRTAHAGRPLALSRSSSRCSSGSASGPGASTRRRRSCARSGATGAAARRARSTRTRLGCERSCSRPARAACKPRRWLRADRRGRRR